MTEEFDPELARKLKEEKKSATRRKFLMGLAGTSVISAATVYGINSSGGSTRSLGSLVGSGNSDLGAPGTTLGGQASAISQAGAAAVSDRILVLIELQGGNDGPSTVVPYGDSAYYDLRPNLAIPQAEVIPIDDQIGLSPELATLSERRFAVVEGVGNTLDSLSHFDQQKLWHFGGGDGRVGFISQLGTELGETYGTDRLVTLSVAGYAPQLVGAGEGTLTLAGANQLRTLTRNDWVYPGYRQAVQRFSGGPLTTRLAQSYSQIGSLVQDLPEEIEIDRESRMIADGGQLGSQLWIAAGMIEAGTGARVIHAKIGGFDTHEGHVNRHAALMAQVDAAVDGFLDRMDNAGLSDRVLVALTSEFGRRGAENGAGLDHGNGSTLMVFGPVNEGRHGVYSSLSNLDDRGNLKTEIPYTSYLRTLAHDWLGTETILPDAESITGLV